jgi:hypothetical protein
VCHPHEIGKSGVWSVSWVHFSQQIPYLHRGGRIRFPLPPSSSLVNSITSGFWNKVEPGPAFSCFALVVLF